MPFMSKATKKCNNGVDHSLHLVSCLLCDLKTIYRVQIYVRTLSKKGKHKQKTKTNINTKYHRISLRKLLKLPSFSSHKAWQILTYFTMTMVQSRLIWTCWKLRQQTHQGSTEIVRLAHWLFKGSKSNHMDTFSGKKAYMRLFDFHLWSYLHLLTSPINHFHCMTYRDKKFKSVLKVFIFSSSSIVHVKPGWWLVDGVQGYRFSVLHSQSN